jgi:hypothetical protein
MGIFCRNKFITRDSFSPNEKLVISTQGIPFEKDVNLIYEIVGPDHYSEKAMVKHQMDWAISYFSPQWVLPFKVGLWKVRIYLKNKKLIESTYLISHHAQKLCP